MRVTLVDSVFDQAADFRLMRLIEWAGYSKEQFGYHRVGDSTPLPEARVYVPMGNHALEYFTSRQGILDVRGYVQSGPGSSYLIPTVHPRFIERGNSKYSAPFIADLQKAATLSQFGLPSEPTEYVLDPSPLEAYRWAQQYLSGTSPYLSFDIETPYKDEEEDTNDTDAPDSSWNIERIGFSYRGHTALSVVWAPEYMGAIRLLLESRGSKVVWNAGYDVPRIKRLGVHINGITHDGMVAWHILHSDLPKSLKFVATFTCPWQPAWKHLSGAKPAFYNATDADVELRSMEVIEAELSRSGLWSVYQNDVIDLEPILVHMSEKGMPVDANIRQIRVLQLSERLLQAKGTMESAVPLEARRIEHVYKAIPKSTDGLLSRPGIHLVPTCSHCGSARPRKDHFKRYVKKSNPCAGAGVECREVEVVEWYRLGDFAPSRDQLVRYHVWLKRPLPMVWDKIKRAKKISFGEKQIKDLILKYPEDPLYPAILDYRSLDKIAGTYLGRPDDH